MYIRLNPRPTDTGYMQLAWQRMVRGLTSDESIGEEHQMYGRVEHRYSYTACGYDAAAYNDRAEAETV